MKDQVLRLCKRLQNCTLNDLLQLIDAQEVVIETILIFLEQEGLIQIKNEIITPVDVQNRKPVERKNMFLMFQHRTDEEIEIIFKGFCLQIPPQKLCHLINVVPNCVCDYYGVFRKTIYDKQFKELLNNFIEKPQIGRYRIFYEKYAYFYVYNNKVFVSDKLLRSSIENNFTKTEIKEFKKMYSYLARIESHNTNETYFHHRLAESIWRRNRNYEELYSELKSLISS